MLKNFLADMRLKSLFFPKQLRLKMKNRVSYKNDNVYLKINIYLTNHLHSGQCCHYIETSRLIYGANQWDGFYTIVTVD